MSLYKISMYSIRGAAWRGMVLYDLVFNLIYNKDGKPYEALSGDIHGDERQ